MKIGDSPIYITKEEAAAALRAVAFPVTDPEDSAYGRTLVHCMTGGTLGADWDLDGALALVERADQIAWHWSLLGHELTVKDADGRTYMFNAQHAKHGEASR